MNNPQPLDIAEARVKIAEMSRQQSQQEQLRMDAARKLAECERVYRLALATGIVHHHAEGVAWTACRDLALGEKIVADLRYERDVARGVLDSCADAAYRHAADRRAMEEIVRWSHSVDVRALGGSGGA